MSSKYLVTRHIKHQTLGEKKHLASISFNGLLIRTTLKAVGRDMVKIMRKLVWKVLSVICFLSSNHSHAIQDDCIWNGVKYYAQCLCLCST